MLVILNKLLCTSKGLFRVLGDEKYMNVVKCEGGELKYLCTASGSQGVHAIHMLGFGAGESNPAVMSALMPRLFGGARRGEIQNLVKYEEGTMKYLCTASGSQGVHANPYARPWGWRKQPGCDVGPDAQAL